MDAARQPNEELIKRCKENTDRYRQGESNDTAYCFELLRRALEANDQEAFTLVYRLYEPQILRWVKRHSGFPDTGERAEHFVSVAITNFYFSLQEKPLERFKTLAQLLTYLKACVHTAIVQHLRKNRLPTRPIDDIEEILGYYHNLAARLHKREIWQRIRLLLPAKRDRLLARCVFEGEMKPLAIAQEHPEYWPSARDVTVNLYNVRKKLREDPVLCQMAGVEQRSG